jgi:hypothetical protein
VIRVAIKRFSPPFFGGPPQQKELVKPPNLQLLTLAGSLFLKTKCLKVATFPGVGSPSVLCSKMSSGGNPNGLIDLFSLQIFE